MNKNNLQTQSKKVGIYKQKESSNSDDKLLVQDVERVKNIIEKNMLDFHNIEYRQYIEDYKRYLGDNSERLQYIESWQSNTSHTLIFMMVDTIFSTVFDFDFQLDLKVKNLEKACVDAYDFKNKAKRALGEAIKEAIITGTGIIRDSLYLEKGRYDAFGEKVEYEIKNPTMDYVSIFNVMYDRIRGLNLSPYKIIRHFLTKDELLNKIRGLISQSDFENYKDKLENKLESIVGENNNCFSVYNYESIKGLLFSNTFQDMIKSEIQRPVNNNKKQKYTFGLETVNDCSELKNFNLKGVLSMFINDFDKKVEVVEYIENNYKYFYVNGYFILKVEINPNIYNLSSFTFNEIPGSGKAVGVSYILKPINDSMTAALNIFYDSIKLGNTIVFKQNGLGKTTNKIQLENCGIINGDLARVNLGGNDFSGMNVVQILNDMAQNTLGINSMIMGGDSRVQRIAGAFDFASSQYKMRLTSFTDSIDMAMTKILKGWLSQYLSFFTKDYLKEKYNLSINPITKDGKEGGIVIDYKIDGELMSDILNENNISFKFDSMFNLKKDIMKKTAMDIFQLAQQYNNQKVNPDKFIELLAGKNGVELDEIFGFDNSLDKEDIDINLDDTEGLDDVSEKQINNILQTLSDGEIEETENLKNGDIRGDKVSLDTNILSDDLEDGIEQNLL